MKNVRQLVVFFMSYVLVATVFNGGVSAEVRLSGFNADNLIRIVNGKPQNLTQILENKTIVVRIASEKESQIQSRFGLRKIGPLPGRSDLIAFEFLKPPVSNEEAIGRWNEISNFSDFASLVFVFPEGRYALSGDIKIQWKKFLASDDIKRVLSAMGLDLIRLDEGTNTTLVRVTEKSGKNTLSWSVVFDPINDPRVFSVSPEFVRILPSIRSQVSVEAGCLRGAQAGAPIASTLCYKIKFYRAPNIEVSFDDLSINTKLLNAWLPDNLPSNLRVFKGERVIEKAVEVLPSGETLDVIEYKLQILRSGEYVLPRLRYYYNVVGNVEENKKRLEGLTDEVYINVSSLALPEQETVNEIPRVIFSKNKMTATGSVVLKAPLWSGILFFVLGICMIISTVVISKKNLKDAAKEAIPSPKKARDLWESKKSFILSSAGHFKVNFFKELLGVYYFDNPYKFASLNSSDWKEKIGAVISRDLAERSAEFIRAAEDGDESKIDFKGLVLDVFNWKEDKK